MKPDQLKEGLIVEFFKNGKTAEGTIMSAGPRRVHIQSGKRGVYVPPRNVRRVVRRPADNELPLLGEEFRLGNGIEQ